jgi:hypothetical protein
MNFFPRTLKGKNGEKHRNYFLGFFNVASRTFKNFAKLKNTLIYVEMVKVLQ